MTRALLLPAAVLAGLGVFVLGPLATFPDEPARVQLVVRTAAPEATR